jgi:hypothetical protein
MRIATSLRVVGALTFLGAAMWAFAPSQASAQEPLRWKLEKGEKLEYDTDHEKVMTIKGTPQGDVSVTTRQQTDMSWEVVDVNEAGDATIRQKVDRVQLKMSAPGQTLEYDSDAKEAPVGNAAMVAGMFDAMRKGEFELTLSARGELKDAKIPDELMAAFKSHPQAAQFGALMTPVAIQKMMMQDLLVLPEKALAEGETWDTKTEIDIPAAGKQSEETTYKYVGTKEIDGKTNAVITAERKMGFAKAENQAGQVEIKEQSFSGEALFDVNEGRLNTSKFTQSVTTVTNASGQTIEQKIDQTSSVTVAPAGAAASAPTAESEAASTESQPK